MNIFVKDQKLNLSPYYLKPGFAFGGSCLPKEVRAVGHLADELGVDLPLVKSLIPTNRAHIEQAIRILAAFKGKRIGFLGVTFKPATDDIRESPTLDVMAELLADGEEILAYDPNMRFGAHLKAQISYVQHSSPHLSELLTEIEGMMVGSATELANRCDVLVVSHATDEFRWAVEGRPDGVHVLDLARLWKVRPDDAGYQGIAW
jgi:GDP-mannose 6-dehydrogenase